MRHVKTAPEFALSRLPTGAVSASCWQFPSKKDVLGFARCRPLGGCRTDELDIATARAPRPGAQLSVRSMSCSGVGWGESGRYHDKPSSGLAGEAEAQRPLAFEADWL